MKNIITRRHALLTAGLALPALLPAAQAAETKAKEAHENHPMHRAIRELKDARAYMEKAPHDFGGHKEQAIKDVDAALKALHAALEFDRASEKKKEIK